MAYIKLILKDGCSMEFNLDETGVKPEDIVTIVLVDDTGDVILPTEILDVPICVHDTATTLKDYTVGNQSLQDYIGKKWIRADKRDCSCELAFGEECGDG